MRSTSLAIVLAAVGTSDHAASALNIRPARNQASGLSKTRQNAVAIPMPDGIPTTVPAPPKQQQQQLNKNDNRNVKLAPEDAWIADMDYEGFRKEVAALGRELRKNTGDADVNHLMKIVQWRNIAAVVGLATVCATPNPLTIAALSTWTYASWTMIAHHTCHGGYNRVEAGRFNSRKFALGAVNRVVDWLDWMQPEAWNVEHNRLHHYRLNEGKDPDLVQRNLEFLQEMKIPMFAKYVMVAAFMPVWKWYYYAPNTYKELKISEWKAQRKELPADLNEEEALTVVSLLSPKRGAAVRKLISPLKFFTTIMGPMLACRFLAIPAMLAILLPQPWGTTLAMNALINLVVADLVSNVHAFITIVTNHAGDDMYTFDDAVQPQSGPFFVRQVIGSANYAYGTDRVDFAHGWLNYQIEHHVWPDLSMLQYQLGAPKLKAICEKYGVPYVQESVFERLRKTVDIMVGKKVMRPFPTQYEPAKDKVKTVTWKTTNGAIDDDTSVTA